MELGADEDAWDASIVKVLIFARVHRTPNPGFAAEGLKHFDTAEILAPETVGCVLCCESPEALRELGREQHCLDHLGDGPNRSLCSPVAPFLIRGT
eukprot:3097505-Rhodomonas_salina.1